MQPAMVHVTNVVYTPVRWNTLPTDLVIYPLTVCDYKHGMKLEAYTINYYNVKQLIILYFVLLNSVNSLI